MLSPDYAAFTLDNGMINPGPRMLSKIKAIPFPDFTGKTILDVGCDYGQFSFWSAIRGASSVLGLDRNRDVRGSGPTNLIAIANANAQANKLNCKFEHINIGKSWKEFGKFDHVLVMSVYHHLFENCGDHKAVWFWLWRHCKESLIWEGPTDNLDKVVQMNVSKPYSKDDIFDAASLYFNREYVGPALHEPHRHVYILRPKSVCISYTLNPENGTGGATKAFEFENGRRMKEIEAIVGYKPYPGSLNCRIGKPFHFNEHYYPGEILDVKERGMGLNQDWVSRGTRFYPVTVNGKKAHVIRFKDAPYSPDFIELIAPTRLRDGETTECQLQ